MRTSAAGSRPRGFTLLEMLVVVALLGIVSAGLAWSMRESWSPSPEREARRLAALLESARAQARTRGVPVQWRVQERGFVFEGLPPGTLPHQWLSSDEMGVRMERPAGESAVLQLGPEPVIAAQSVLLWHRSQPGQRWRVATDGLRAFAVQPASEAP